MAVLNNLIIHKNTKRPANVSVGDVEGELPNKISKHALVNPFTIASGNSIRKAVSSDKVNYCLFVVIVFWIPNGERSLF